MLVVHDTISALVEHRRLQLVVVIILGVVVFKSLVNIGSKVHYAEGNEGKRKMGRLITNLSGLGRLLARSRHDAKGPPSSK